jgi:hypothetical protein
MEISKSGDGMNDDLVMQSEYPPVDQDGLHI